VQAKCDKRVSKPQCLRFKVFAEELVSIESQKVKCVASKPTYVGIAVLESSKLCMYGFHYQHFTQWYPEADLPLTHTDSLLCHIETDDLYADLAAHRLYLDLVEYIHDQPLLPDKNKMVVGKMKDESVSGIITDYVGLRPKCTAT
jgi:hypothetical protein